MTYLIPSFGMPEEEDTELEILSPEERKASPIAGCLIFIILIAVFTTLGGFIVYTYHANKGEMEKISQAEKVEVRLANYVPAHLEELENKLNAFSEDVKAKKKSELTITVQDLNIGIAKLEKMKEFREKMYITAIHEDGIHAEISLPVKAGFTGSNRYINGTMTMRPEIEQGSLFPIIETIEPATGEEVIERIKRFLPQALFSAYRNDPDLINVFHKLSEVELHEGKMVITSDPEKNTVHQPTLAEGKDNLYTGLAVVGILFFVFFSTGVMIYFILKRSKKRKAELTEQKKRDIEEDLRDRQDSSNDE